MYCVKCAIRKHLSWQYFNLHNVILFESFSNHRLCILTGRNEARKERWAFSMKTDRLLGSFAYIHYICQLVPNRNNRPTEFTNRIESRWPFERGVMRFANRPPCRSLKLLFQKLGVCSPFFPSSLDNPPARYVATESTNEEPTTGVHNI